MARLGHGLREALREGYGAADLRADLMAGTVVGVVALPLSMALAIASGVPPQHGLYTAIVAGIVIALLGGSRTQVSGPPPPSWSSWRPSPPSFGLGGLLLATLLAGVLLVAMGLARLGRLIEFIPYPVTTGFTAGIAVVIATLQIKDLLGLQRARAARALPRAPAGPGARPAHRALADAADRRAFTLAILFHWPRLTRRVPAPLVALSSPRCWPLLLARLVPGLRGRDHRQPLPPCRRHPRRHPPAAPARAALAPARPRGPPLVLCWPWCASCCPRAFAIAMLGAIESLLSAVVADGMTGTKHDPDAELIAQGVGNLMAPFFGGFAATGAIARTATNVRSGAPARPSPRPRIRWWCCTMMSSSIPSCHWRSAR